MAKSFIIDVPVPFFAEVVPAKCQLSKCVTLITTQPVEIKVVDRDDLKPALVAEFDGAEITYLTDGVHLYRPVGEDDAPRFVNANDAPVTEANMAAWLNKYIGEASMITHNLAKLVPWMEEKYTAVLGRDMSLTR